MLVQNKGSILLFINNGIFKNMVLIIVANHLKENY